MFTLHIFLPNESQVDLVHILNQPEGNLDFYVETNHLIAPTLQEGIRDLYVYAGLRKDVHCSRNPHSCVSIREANRRSNMHEGTTTLLQ